MYMYLGFYTRQQGNSNGRLPRVSGVGELNGTISERLRLETGGDKFKLIAAKTNVSAIPDTSTHPIASIALATVGIHETL